jgi:hypothetical protein
MIDQRDSPHPHRNPPRISMRRLATAGLLSSLLLARVYGQALPTDDSRAAEITREREQKERTIGPETNSKWEDLWLPKTSSELKTQLLRRLVR